MINFLKYQKMSFVFFILLVILGSTFYFKRGGFVYGIDFTGGSEIRLKFNHSVDSSLLRNALEASGNWKEVVLQNLEGGFEFLLKIQESGDSVESEISNVLQESFPDAFVISSIERVGPEAGKEVGYNSIIAVLWTLFVLGLYITLRNKMAFALGAIIALAHDVLVILVYNLVFGEAINLGVLMGVLAVLGYSLNDTVVMYSRIIGNYGLLKKMGPEELINLSINQTLSRTLLTSISTFIAVLMLFVFGGVALNGFSVTMMLGVVFGTYSSIYIANPIVLYFDKYLQNQQVKKNY